ncbi:hypothetical protein [Parafrankia elaeagni]|uniref:hypothetical protein n=1 Tax=Parafrankia elaeagni TaxID=222534 RepID=UPI0012B55BF3|nr:hypothetical protein [Parafrankia elaeagni]
MAAMRRRLRRPRFDPAGPPAPPVAVDVARRAAADPDLLDHAARGGMPGRLDEVAAHRILAALLRDSLTDTAYPAPALAT